MFKLLDRLFEHWNKKIAENCWYFLIELGEMFAFVLVLSELSKLIALLLAKDAFSSYPHIDLMIFSIFGFIIIVIGFAYSVHEEKEAKRAKAKLANRQISDYENKYQKYVDLVENLLHTKGYEEIQLAEDWVKQFDRYLTNTARLQLSQKHDFTDFELATCLMYSLTSNNSSSRLYVDFAFQCAKGIINCPAVYNCKYLAGGELYLDVQTTLEYIDNFSILTPEQDAFVISLLAHYLPTIDIYDKFLEVANLLKILYKYCEQQQ